MPASKVQINLGAVGHGETLVDGVNLASAVTGLRFDSAPDRFNRLTLDLLMQEVEIDAEAHVIVPDATRDALITLGWTPPADEPNTIHECPADGSTHENSERCACRPVRLLDDEHGNRIYRHDPAVAD